VIGLTSSRSEAPSIAVFGLGYVGCVTAACFSHLGFRVTGVEVDDRKVCAINEGRSPFYEPGLEALIRSGIKNSRLSATTCASNALREADFAFVCVGTPSASNGNLDVDQLRRVSGEIASHLTGRTRPLAVVIRSTVFPGTCDEVVSPTLRQFEGCVSVVANPEFLREGAAVKDFMEPSLLVVGSHDRHAAERVAALYSSLPVVSTLVSLRTAELIKYVCNAFHAMKIAFANEVGTLASALELDGSEVMDTVCRDTKLNISRAYLKPGFAFGGSCLPKDLRTINYRSRRNDLELPLLNSIIASNEAHIARAFQRIAETGFRRIGIYGLAFKPNTDDLRESPGVALIERLIGKGYDVKIFDPQIQLDAIYGSNLAFLLRVVPHIGRCMERDLDALLNGSQMIVTTLQPSLPVRERLASSGIPVMRVDNFESAEGCEGRVV
jgi:GDP-mannose 6-dehydrogenase